MEVEPGVASQPPLDQRTRVRGKIVENHMAYEVGLHSTVNLAKEVDEVLRAVLRLRSCDYLAGRNLSSGPSPLTKS
jgi:hypothetical protein